MSRIEVQTRTSGWQALLDALAGPHAFGLEVALSCIFLLVARCLLIDPIWALQQSDSTLNLVVVTAATGIATFVVAWWVHVSARSRRLTRTARATQTVVILLLVVCTVAIMPVVANPQHELNLAGTWQRIVSGFVVTLVIIYLFDQRDRRRTTILRLMTQQRRLEQQRASYSQSLHQLRARLAEIVEREAGPHLERLISEVDKLAGAPAQRLHSVADQVRACSLNVVRQLSHTLDLEPAAPPILADESELSIEKSLRANWRQTNPRQLLSQLFAMRPFRPLTVAAFLSYGVFSPVTSRVGIIAGLVSAVLMFSVIFSFFGLADRFLAPWLQRQSLATRIQGVIAVIVASTVVAAALLSFSLSFISPLRTGMLILIGLSLCSFGVALGVLLFDQRQELLRDLSATLESLSWESSRLQDDELAIRREVAGLLHSNVQGRMAAVAARLDNKALLAEQGELDPRRLEQGVHACSSALRDSLAQMRSLTAPHSTRIGNLVQELQTVVSAWSEVMDVKIDVSPDVVHQINSSGAVAAAVVHVVREGLTNSMRHGHATQVSVRITSMRQYVQISLVDDGVGVSKDFVPGLGLNSMMRAGAQVRLGQRAVKGAELDVRLPAALVI